MTKQDFNIYFEKLPLWKGVAFEPGLPEFYPFSLGWNELGYLYQTTPKAILNRIIQSYSADKYQFITSPPGFSSWGNARAQDTIKFVLDAFGSLKGTNILEIGAGTTFLAEKFIVEHGASIYTIMDPAINEMAPSASIKVIRDYFNLDTCPEENFDLVLGVSCLEHVEDPVNFLRDVQKVLRRKNGKAILLFPDCEPQLLCGDFNVLLHEHLSYFTKNTFKNVIRLCNLKMMIYKSIPGGLYCMLESSEIIDNYINNQLSITEHNITKYNSIFQKSIDYFNKLLNQFIESNQKVAFHGACNALNNVLALSDLHNDLFSLNMIRIFDGDENKAGKYLPMCPSPIINSFAPEYKNFDQVIISAVSFYDQIKDFLINYHGISPDHIHAMIPKEND